MTERLILIPIDCGDETCDGCHSEDGYGFCRALNRPLSLKEDGVNPTFFRHPACIEAEVKVEVRKPMEDYLKCRWFAMKSFSHLQGAVVATCTKDGNQPCKAMIDFECSDMEVR